MKNLRNIIPEKYETWIRAAIYSVLFIVLWLIMGIVLSDARFDNPSFEIYKVLNKNYVLAYLAAVLAIQIPIFILFLQQMSEAGFIRRKILPRVTKFKEIILTLLTGALLVVLSPRESYLYFPLAVLAILNVVAVFKAIQVTFHLEQYDNAIKKMLKVTSVNSFVAMDLARRKFNKLFAEIEKTKFVEISFFETDIPDTVVVPIKAKADGLLEYLDVKGVANLLAEEFKSTALNLSDTKQKAVPRLSLRSTPNFTVEADDTIAVLILPSHAIKPEKIGKRVEKYFRINTKQAKLPIIRYFDELISEFERGLETAVKTDNVDLLKDILDQLKYMFKHMDASISSDDNNSRENDTYYLEDSYKELTMLINDDFSKHLLRFYEMLSDNLVKSIAESKESVAEEIITFAYRDLINSTEKPNTSTIARADSTLTYAAGQFVYSNTWNKLLDPVQEELRARIFFRLKEQTGLLSYHLKNTNGKFDSTNPIQQLFERRITRLKDLILASIKNKSEVNFKSAFEILSEVETDAHYDKLSEQNDTLVKCTVFMIGAYIKHNGLLGTYYGKSIFSVFSHWTSEELLTVLLECSKNDYAGSWQIDTYDHAADGVVRSVPNYNTVMKKLWADIMLTKSFTTDPEHFQMNEQLEQTLLFTNGLSTENDNDLLNYVKLSTSPKKDGLIKHIENIIGIRRKWETTKLAKEPLDKIKTEKFAQEVNDAFVESSIAVKLFTGNRLKVDSTNAHKNFKELGINQIFDKEAFITDWHSGYITDHFAEQLGRQIAQGQDKSIFVSLFTNPTTCTDARKLINVAKGVGGKWVVISNQVNNWELETSYSEYLSKKSDMQKQYLKGLSQHHEIQRIYSEDIPSGLYLVRQDQIGILTQKQDLKQPVLVQIDAYSQNNKLMNGLIGTRPDWLLKYGDETKQKAFLATKTRLHVANIFKYEKPNANLNVLYLPIIEKY